MLIIAATNRPNAVSLDFSKYLGEKLDRSDVEHQFLSLSELPMDYLESCLYENAGKNVVFNEILDRLGTHEKLIFVIPEYNGSFPGVLKAFIDGLRFPEGIQGKKAALVGISSGNQGSSLAMSHFTDILNYLGCAVLPTKTRIPFIEKNFIEGKLVDSGIETLINQQLEAFNQF